MILGIDILQLAYDLERFRAVGYELIDMFVDYLKFVQGWEQ